MPFHWTARRISAAPLIRRRCSHSSGLPREGNFNYWFTGRFPDQPELDRYLEEQSLRFSPGAELAYSNIGYAALGRLLERQSGQSYAALLEERIVRPLALTSTGAAAPPGDLSRGYTPRDRIIPNASRPFAGVGEAVGDRHLREYHDAASITPAFGIHSNARDLAIFGAALVAEESTLLSAESRRRMLSPQRFGRGLGLRIENLGGRQVARHSGWFAAHRSQLLLDDEANISIAVLTNSDDGNPHTLVDELYRLAIGAGDE